MRSPSSPRARRLAAATMASMMVGLMLVGCEIADPEMPRYTMHLTVPLGEERLDIADVVDDEDYLVTLEDGSLGFLVEGDPDTVSFDFDLAADINPQAISGEIGNFEISVGDPVHFDFELVDLYPDAAGLDGATVPLPAFGFSSPSGAEDIADLQSATLSAGTLTVTLFNGLPVPVSALSGPDRLVLDVVDPADLRVLTSMAFDPIAPGSQAIQSVDLAGVVLPGALSVTISGGSPGSDGTPVFVDAAALITVDAAFTDLEVSAAEAVLDAQEFTTSFDTDLPDDYAVTHAVIGQGNVTLAMLNEMSIPCQTMVSWADIQDLDGQPLTLVVDLDPGAETTREVDFSGHVVRAPAGTELTVLTATVTVTSPGSGGLVVPMQADQGVQATLDGGRIEFSSVTGTVPESSYDFDPFVEELDLPDELEGLSMPQASMTLVFENSAGVTARTDLTLVGTSDDGSYNTLLVQEEIAAAGDERSTVTTIVLDDTNSSIVEFLADLPREISLTGGVSLGGDGSIGTVHWDDDVVVSWQIASPVEVVIESSRLFGDIKELDLGQDTRERLADYAGRATVELEVLNHFPVGIEVSLLFSPDSTTVKTDPLLVVGPAVIAPGIVDPATHTVTEPTTSHPTLVLSAADMQLIASETLYEVYEIVLPSTNGQAVRVLTSDYVTVSGLIDLNVNVHADDD